MLMVHKTAQIIRHLVNISGTLLATSIGKYWSAASGTSGSIIGCIPSGFTIAVVTKLKIRHPIPNEP